MRKVRLEIDELSVESFETAARETEARGTVRGYVTSWDTCVDDSCAESCVSYCGTGCTGDGWGCGGTGSTGGSGGWSREGCVSMGDYSGCDLSCEFAC